VLEVLSRVADRVVELRPILAFVFGLVQMPDGTQAVGVAIPRLAEQDERRSEMLVDALDA
jgi:hypothetical protein